jgi:hypothetical protein
MKYWLQEELGILKYQIEIDRFNFISFEWYNE